MKQFFKFFFASLAALFIFMLLIFVVFGGIIAGSASKDQTIVDNNSVLCIDLNENITEQTKENQLGILSGQPTSIVGLNDVLASIKAAKSDEKINGIYIKLGMSPIGWATLQEIKDAIEDFKTSKKFVYAYGEIADQKSVYMSTISDSSFVNPSGGVEFKGLAISGMFYKGTLEKLDVKTEAFHCGQFKGAHEPYSRENFSDANRFQLTALLNDFYAELLMAISKKSGLDTATLAKMANEGTIKFPKDAVAYKVINGTRFSDEVELSIKNKLAIKETDKISFISPDDYAETIVDKTATDKIAILYAEGAIYDGEGDEEIYSKTFTKSIRKIKNDDKIKAVVLRINSPGGSALASEVMYHELEQLNKVKPIIVSMGNYAASGGYYLSCAGDSIFADQNTLTGSIGVVGVMFNMGEFYKNKLGITTDVVKTAEHADFPNLTRPMSEFEHNWIQGFLDTTYMLFKSRVAKARNLTMQEVEELAQGHVYSGKAALNLKLIDGLGNVDRALKSASAMAKVTDYKIVEYPKPIDKVQEIVNQLSGNKREEAIMKKVLGEEYVVFKEIQKVKSQQNQVQMALPWLFDIR
jgi:protease-4